MSSKDGSFWGTLVSLSSGKSSSSTMAWISPWDFSSIEIYKASIGCTSPLKGLDPLGTWVTCPFFQICRLQYVLDWECELGPIDRWLDECISWSRFSNLYASICSSDSPEAWASDLKSCRGSVPPWCKLWIPFLSSLIELFSNKKKLNQPRIESISNFLQFLKTGKDSNFTASSLCKIRWWTLIKWMNHPLSDRSADNNESWIRDQSLSVYEVISGLLSDLSQCFL